MKIKIPNNKIRTAPKISFHLYAVPKITTSAINAKKIYTYLIVATLPAFSYFRATEIKYYDKNPNKIIKTIITTLNNEYLVCSPLNPFCQNTNIDEPKVVAIFE